MLISFRMNTTTILQTYLFYNIFGTIKIIKKKSIIVHNKDILIRKYKLFYMFIRLFQLQRIKPEIGR